MDRTIRGWIAIVLTVGLTLHMTDGLAVMSVDLGSEFMKVAIVKNNPVQESFFENLDDFPLEPEVPRYPGVPMEVALNKESGRKTAVAVSMRNGERLFSDGAKSTSVRYPKDAYIYIQELLAKSLDNPVVKRYQERFPFYELEEEPETKTVYYKHNEEESYTPEELLAMVLEHAKDIAEKFAEQPVNDVVITVPPYFNQAERRAMLRAGEIAGLKVLQIMNDNSAVALNYGVFRRKAFNATAVHYMFFDMGATSTSATVVAYQEVKTKNKVTGITEKDPQLTVKGVGFNRNLGGLELQLRLRDHLANKFNEQKKTSTNIKTSPRAMAKLFKEAGRLKHVLSANTEHFAQIESLFEDVDFKVKVTRDEFEEMSADLFEKVGVVVEEALKTSEVTMDEIKEVILMGGGTRVPQVQAHLQKAIGREELGKSVNTDEAAALGAVYQAAHLSKGFKVKKFIVKEATIYPIQVEFERAKQSGTTGEIEKKMVSRTLFGKNNPYPQNKVMTFNKHSKDFEFEVNYGDLDFMSEEDKQSFGSKSLYQINLSGVDEAYGKHKDEADSKGIKAHFKMENSGILELDKVEFVFEKQPPAEPEQPEEEKTTLEKLGNAFSGLFGGGDSPAEPTEEEKEALEEGSEIKAEKDDDSEEKVEKATSETETKEEQQQQQTVESETEESETKNTKSESSDETPESETDKEGEEEETEGEDETRDEEPVNEEVQEDAEKSVENGDVPDSGKEEEEKQETETPSKSEDEAEETEKKSEEKSGDKDKPEGGEKEEDKKEGSEEEAGKEEDKKDKKREKKKEKEEKPKVVIMREEIIAGVNFKDLPEPSKEAVRTSKKKIKDLRAKDEEKLLLEKAKNDLETFIIDAQDKLYQDDYITCSTEEQREKITTKLSEASDWLYELEEDAARELYVQSLKDLKKATKKLWDRVQERRDQPKAIEALNSIMNYSMHFLFGMKNFTGEEVGEQPFTKVEYETLEKLITETKEWNDTIMAEHAATPATESPKVRMEDFGVKIQALDREIKYLTNKVKTFRPKVKKEDTNTTKTEDTNKTDKAETLKTKIKKDLKEEGEEQQEVEEEQEVEGGEGDSAKQGDEETQTDTEQQKVEGEQQEVEGGEDDSVKQEQMQSDTAQEEKDKQEKVLDGAEASEEEDSQKQTTDGATETVTEKDSEETTAGKATHDPQDL